MKTPGSYAHRLRMGGIFTYSCSILCPLATSRDAKGGVVRPIEWFLKWKLNQIEK
jgi:hypothetical protein